MWVLLSRPDRVVELGLDQFPFYLLGRNKNLLELAGFCPPPTRLTPQTTHEILNKLNPEILLTVAG